MNFDLQCLRNSLIIADIRFHLNKGLVMEIFLRLSEIAMFLKALLTLSCFRDLSSRWVKANQPGMRINFASADLSAKMLLKYH